MSRKKVKVESQDDEGHDYFQSLPDELLILIFTKLSSGDGESTIKDIQLLGQCSIISNRFNSLTSLVPTLHIIHPSITVVCNIFPKILNKFKHITSLRVKYVSRPRCIDPRLTHIPCIFTKAIYKPHYYCLSVLAFTDHNEYSGQQQQCPRHSYVGNVTEHENKLCKATDCYATALFYLHHRLVSSIRDHKLLKRVVVSDMLGRENFSLVDKQLVELRNITSPGLEQVHGYQRRGFHDILGGRYRRKDGGFVLKNVCFSLFQKWENSSGGEDDIPHLDGDKWLQQVLELMMEENIYLSYKIVPRIISHMDTTLASVVANTCLL